MWYVRRHAILKPLFVLVHGAVLLTGLSLPMVLALQTVTADGRWSWAAWHGWLLDVDRWGVLLRNSLVVGLGAALIAGSFGVILALAAFKAAWFGRRFLVLLVLLLASIPAFVTTTGLMSVLEIRGPQESAATAGLLYGLIYIPLASLIVGLGLTYVEAELEEAAWLEGSAWVVMRHVSVPRAWWSVASAVMVVFWLVVNDYTITDILQVRTFAEEIYTQYQLWGQRVTPFVVAVPLMVLLIAGFAVLQRWARVLSRPPFQSSARRTFLVPLGAWGHLAVWALVGSLVAGVVGCLSFLWKYLGSGVTQGLGSQAAAAPPVGPRWWTDLQAVAPDWLNTLQMAAATSVITAGLAVGVAWCWTRSRRWRVLTGVMLLALLATPAPGLALTVYTCFSREYPQWLSVAVLAIYDSMWINVLTLTLRFLPVAVLVILPAIASVPRSVIDAARCEGADWFDILASLHWPSCRSAVASAALIVLILSIGELDCVHIVSPPGFETLSKRYFSFIHTGIDSQVATVCLAALASAVVPALLLYWQIRRRGG